MSIDEKPGVTSADRGRVRQAGPPDAILFDLDGTLIDTTALIFRSYQHALQVELGAPAAPEQLYVGYGQPLHASFRAILRQRGTLPPNGAADRLIERLVQTYRAFNQAHHDQLARPFPGVREALDVLHRAGVPLGLVTSKIRSMALRGLELIGAADDFQTLVFMEDTPRHKPNPDPLWAALDRLALRDHAGSVLYVGDSTHDLEAGHAAGVQTGAALWGPFPEPTLRALKPTYLLRTPGDLARLFG